jgi:hypothetical protein
MVSAFAARQRLVLGQVKVADKSNEKQRDPKLAASWGPTPTPPKATKDGGTRYDAWRLPPAGARAKRIRERRARGGHRIPR